MSGCACGFLFEFCNGGIYVCVEGFASRLYKGVNNLIPPDLVGHLRSSILRPTYRFLWVFGYKFSPKTHTKNPKTLILPTSNKAKKKQKPRKSLKKTTYTTTPHFLKLYNLTGKPPLLYKPTGNPAKCCEFI